ncbi:MAG: fatty-acid synthase [Armatimonadetes bacterium]|nr:fatty-acid synthase [Armatimonadota bacterium]
MPQRDLYHDAVKQALVKDGWIITHDPLLLSFARRNLYVDLEAPLAAEKEGRRIAVEVKSFLGASEVTDLERALGQYALYRALLGRQEPDRVLYLAVPCRVFENFLIDPDAQTVLTAEQVRLVVFDPDKEAILSWTG